MLPFVLINIYYTKTENERALLNDIAAILIFAIAGMAAYFRNKSGIKICFQSRSIRHFSLSVRLYM